MNPPPQNTSTAVSNHPSLRMSRFLLFDGAHSIDAQVRRHRTIRGSPCSCAELLRGARLKRGAHGSVRAVTPLHAFVRVGFFR